MTHLVHSVSLTEPDRPEAYAQPARPKASRLIVLVSFKLTMVCICCCILPGDAFRAAFAVALVEGWPMRQCLHFAAAAGAIAVSRMGAVPSLPNRSEVLELLGGTWSDRLTGTSTDPLAGTSGDPASMAAAGDPAISGTNSDSAAAGTCSDQSPSGTCTAADSCRKPTSSSSRGVEYPCPLKFASRLNSMKARRDLVVDQGTAVGRNDVLGWIARQGQVKGLHLVDLNYPQHLEGTTTEQVRITAHVTCVL